MRASTMSTIHEPPAKQRWSRRCCWLALRARTLEPPFCCHRSRFVQWCPLHLVGKFTRSSIPFFQRIPFFLRAPPTFYLCVGRDCRGSGLPFGYHLGRSLAPLATLDARAPLLLTSSQGCPVVSAPSGWQISLPHPFQRFPPTMFLLCGWGTTGWLIFSPPCQAFGARANAPPRRNSFRLLRWHALPRTAGRHFPFLLEMKRNLPSPSTTKQPCGVVERCVHRAFAAPRPRAQGRRIQHAGPLPPSLWSTPRN